jgi:hypothetical protein
MGRAGRAGRPRGPVSGVSGDAIELGYRWAAVQIPVQYLPGRPGTSDVEAVLDQIEQALGRL